MLMRTSYLVRKKIRDMNIFTKISTLVIVEVIVFICIVGFMAGYTSSNTIKEQAKAPISTALNVVKHNIELYLNYSVSSVSFILADIESKEIFPINENMDDSEIKDRYNRLMWDVLAKQYDEQNKIGNRTVAVMKFINFIPSNEVAFNDYATPFFYQTAVSTTESVNNEEWFKDAGVNSRNLMKWYVKKFSSPEIRKNYLIAAKYQKGAGLLTIGFDMTEIDKYFANSIILIIDENGKVLHGKKIGDVGEDVSNKDYIKEILSKDNGQFSSPISGSNYLISFERLNTFSNNKWKIASLVPSDNLLPDVKKVIRVILITGLACIITSILLSILIAKGITDPIKILIKTMRNIKEGRLDITLDRDSGDEIGELYSTFNKMIREINQLIEKIYKSEKNLKEIEIKFLQSQINPHFLYNTLNTIKWMGIINNVPTISTITTDLVKLLRNSIGKEGYMITVEGEIENLQSYIRIQQARFNDAFEVSYDIEDEILGYYIFKLILQPIVENSMNYAFNDRKTKGNIKVKGYKKQHKLTFEIIDDGTGINELQFNQLLLSIESSESCGQVINSFSGIGLKNIQDRIQLSYGNDFGLSLESKPDIGTKVTLELPVVLIQEEEGKRVIK